MKCCCLNGRFKQCQQKTYNEQLCNFHFSKCSSWSCLPSKLPCDEVIISKTNSRIISAKKTFNNDIVCVKKKKVFDKHSLKNDIVKKYFFDWHECIILSELKHDNIIEILKFYKKDNFILLHFPLLKYSLKTFIKINKSIDFHLLYKSILQALIYLQDNKRQISHRDIRESNILIENDKFLLSDFGNALSFNGTFKITPESSPFAGRRVFLKNQKIIHLTTKRFFYETRKDSILFSLKKSIPIDFYFDLLDLYGIVKKYKYIEKLEKIYSTEIEFKSFFITDKHELFLASKQHILHFS